MSSKPHTWEPLSRKQGICRATCLGSPGSDSLLCWHWDPPGQERRKSLCGGLREEGGAWGHRKCSPEEQGQERYRRGTEGTQEGPHAGKRWGGAKSSLWVCSLKPIQNVPSSLTEHLLGAGHGPQAVEGWGSFSTPQSPSVLPAKPPRI